MKPTFPGVRLPRPALIALAVAVAAYSVSLAALQRLPGASVFEPLFLLAVLGVAFPLLAWLRTLKPRRAPRPQVAEAPQLAGLMAYLAVFSILVLGWGFSALNQTFPDEPEQSVAQLAVKLITMVALPAWLFPRLRPGAQPLFSTRRLLLVFAVMSLAYLALQAVFGRGLTTLGNSPPPQPRWRGRFPPASCGRRSKRACARKCCSAGSCRKRSPWPAARKSRRWPGRRCCSAWPMPPDCGCSAAT